jgi:molybdopterin-guanine dinucleotide biosynthesis protein
LRQRAFIHFAGPEGAGKTTLIETVLQRVDPPILVARCRRDDHLAEPEESSPRTDPELRRYLEAGADGVALFTFPEAATTTDDFFMTGLMAEYSRAVVLEGDSPLSGSSGTNVGDRAGMTW